MFETRGSQYPRNRFKGAATYAGFVIRPVVIGLFEFDPLVLDVAVCHIR
ncbi:MAG: hypothetical protein RLZZ214_1544 [Verrucomicrobiota bacterium]|jgi:hypothetical protein